jgi:Tfp pilus assembly protein PilN
MIKINLLGVSKEALKEMAGAQASAEVAQRVAGLEKYKVPIMAVALVAGVLVSGMTWYSLNAKLEKTEEDLREQEALKRELEAVAKKVEEFEKTKKNLETKYNTLRNLREQQVTPVYVMDDISSRLDDYVWLESLDLKEKSLKLKGTAYTIISMTNFMRNLQDSPYFSSVILLGAKENKGYIAFDLSCTLRMLRPGEPVKEEGGKDDSAKAKTRGSKK